MSRFGLTRQPFGPTEREFRLGLKEWATIDEERGVGPPELLARLGPLARAVQAKLSFTDMLTAGLLGTWKAGDVQSVLANGLIGAGLASTEAGVLVRLVMDDTPPWELAPLAFLVVMAGVAGAPEDTPVPQPPAAARKRARRSKTAASASPT